VGWSRTNRGHSLVAAGRVLVGGGGRHQDIAPGSPGEPLVVIGAAARFCEQGWGKLDAALEHFDLDVDGKDRWNGRLPPVATELASTWRKQTVVASYVRPRPVASSGLRLMVE